MAAAKTDADDGIVGINITPFVDISLVLLVIFMVTAKYIVSQEVPVDLPEAASSTAMDGPVHLAVDHAGHFYMDGGELDGPALTAALEARHAHDPELRAVIAADRGVEEGRVIELINLVTAAQITHFAIQTQPHEEP